MQTERKFTKPSAMSGYSATTIVVNSKVTIEITSILDNPTKKTVTAFIVGKPYNVILWEGAAYDAIGQWTDIDVRARIIVLFN